MNRLDSKARTQVISALLEGCSIRSTVRMTGVSKKTVMRLLVEAGKVAADYQDRLFRNLDCKRLELDELWAFIAAKQKNVTAEMAAKNPAAGDVWLWVAIDADTKLVPSWTLGNRDLTTAYAFVDDLASRLKNRVQITTDGHRPYIEAIDRAFSGFVDYSILQKIYGKPGENDTRYSPAQCIGIETRRVCGNPNLRHASTSYVERQNLSVRMCLRRYTRLTNAFSRKLENHAAAVALYYFSYNLIKIHGTLRCSPAMAAGVVNHLYEVSDLVALLEATERAA
jgi:IS1 family transposase